jgi:circadian clock protein KaiC
MKAQSKARKKGSDPGSSVTVRPFPPTRGTLAKSPSGIHGLDEITAGGLPRGRPTLVCGGAGSGKTLFAMEFLVRGIVEHGEPGVFMSFEESEEELAANVASLGFDLRRLIEKGKLAIDHVRIERNEIEETGEFDLGGLFVRMEHATKTVGAKRVVLDTVESLFATLPNPEVLRSELRRLFRWLKVRGLTAVITGEKGEGTLTRHGLEEYVSDCVIALDHRVNEQISTRRLRVVKYRGSLHGTNEYPFLIDEQGISVLPITSLGLAHTASSERISTGIVRLDEMFGGAAYFKGSTVLVSGSAGTGKTSVAAHLVRLACDRGERVLFFAYEESPAQLARNMRSIGIDLEAYMTKGLLRVHPSRPQASGLELHLVSAHKSIVEFDPAIVVVDPITNLINVASLNETRSMLTRLIDFLKMRGTTALFTSLTAGDGSPEQTDVGISSLIDTWIMLETVESGGERNRLLTIVKSRGMAHSNQKAEYRIGADGIRLVDTYLGPSGVLTGSARLAQEAADQAAATARTEALARMEAQRERKRRALEGHIAALRNQWEAEDGELEETIRDVARQGDCVGEARTEMAGSRLAFDQKTAQAPKAGRTTLEQPRGRRGGKRR